MKNAKVTRLQDKIAEEKDTAEKIFHKSVDDYTELKPEYKQRDLDMIAKEAAEVNAQKENEVRETEETMDLGEEKPPEKKIEETPKKVIEETPQGIKYNGKTYVEIDDVFKDKELTRDERQNLYEALNKWEDDLRKNAAKISSEIGKQLGLKADEAENNLKDDNDKQPITLKNLLYIVFSILVFAGLIGFINHISNNIRKTSAEKEARVDSIKAVSVKADSIIIAERTKAYYDFINNADSMKMALSKIKGIDKYTTITNGDSEFFFYVHHTEQWFIIKMNKYYYTPMYEMRFERSPIGREHALSKIIELCDINDKNFNIPDREDEILKTWDIKGFRLCFSQDSESIAFVYRMPSK